MLVQMVECAGCVSNEACPIHETEQCLECGAPTCDYLCVDCYWQLEDEARIDSE